MKNIKPVLVLIFCFLLGMVTISLITGCDQQTAGLPQSPPTGDGDLIGEGDETPIDDIPDAQPADLNWMRMETLFTRWDPGRNGEGRPIVITYR